MQNDSLTFSERFLLLAVSGFLAILIIAMFRGNDGGTVFISKKVLQGSLVKVHIEGLVAHPGTYELVAGTTVVEALERAGILPEGRGWGVRRKERIYANRSLYVPAQKKKSLVLRQH